MQDSFHQHEAHARGPFARTPMNEWHIRRGEHTGAKTELQAGRDGTRLIDLCLSAKRSLLGKGVADFVASRFPDSAAVRTRGATVSLGPPRILACRLSSDQLLLQADSADEESLCRWIGDLPASSELSQVGMTSALASVLLEGARSEDLLRRLTAFDVSEQNFPANACAETSLAGVQVLLVRVQESGAPSIRLLVSWDFGEYLWETLWDAGQAFGISAVGWDAWRALHRRLD